DLPVYVEGAIQARAEALYRAHPELAEVNKMAAGNAPVTIHELGHHLIKRHAINLDPASLPADVLTGLRQFDYQPNRANIALAAQEGFAEYLRRRETDQLTCLSREQQAAASWAERILGTKPGVMDKLDRVREMFRRFAGLTPGEQFAGQISPTGQPAQAQV